MASLRRLVSLDCASTPWSPPSRTSPLARHSSLPNFFLSQPELAMGALINRHPSLSSTSSPLLHDAQTASPNPARPPLARMASIHPRASHGPSDDTPDFDKYYPPGNAQGMMYRPFGQMRRQHSAPLPDFRKDAVSASDGFNVEKSLVYAELRESSYSWQAPPGFSRSCDGIEKLLAGTPPCKPILDHLAGTPDEHEVQTLSDLRMQTGNGRNAVKDPPMSLRMLKRKMSKANAPARSDLQWNPLVKSAPDKSSHVGAARPPRRNVMGVGDSVSTAFASLVHMMQNVQQHAFSTDYMPPCASLAACAADESSQQTWVHRAQAEMLDSFLWLFQQVFSCTPKLMLLTMILLADFTMHSLSKHVALPVMSNGELPTPATFLLNVDLSGISSVEAIPNFHSAMAESLSKYGALSTKDGSHYPCDTRLLGLDEYSWKSGVSTDVNEDTTAGRISMPPELSSSVDSPWLNHNLQDAERAILDQTIKKLLVAPVIAPVLEPDDYPCFDRTDLTYQHEIRLDPSNPLLLANYAQFLHVVRHDNSRAEKLYRRAALVDRDADGELLWRFASFLWVVKGDMLEADKAYKAAIAADPSNAYHAGSYAHFLWTSNASQSEETFCSAQNLGTVS